MKVIKRRKKRKRMARAAEGGGAEIEVRHERGAGICNSCAHDVLNCHLTAPRSLRTKNPSQPHRSRAHQADPSPDHRKMTPWAGRAAHCANEISAGIRGSRRGMRGQVSTAWSANVCPRRPSAGDSLNQASRRRPRQEEPFHQTLYPLVDCLVLTVSPYKGRRGGRPGRLSAAAGGGRRGRM